MRFLLQSERSNKGADLVLKQIDIEVKCIDVTLYKML